MNASLIENVVNLWVKLILTMSIILNICAKKIKTKRRWWTKPHLKEAVRERYGAYKTIFMYFKLNDKEEFCEFVGMTVDQFNELLTLVAPKLRKKSRRKSLEPELRLAAVLNFLVHGNCVKKTSWFFLIGRSTMYKMIVEVCVVICQVLQKIYIAFPKEDDWLHISKYFYKIWNFPNCIGALDGKHIRVKAPPNSGLYFYCYKKYFSIIIMAMCDAFRRFTWVNIGDFGSMNDAGVFHWSDLGQALNAGQIPLPVPSPLPGTDTICPYVIVADGGFPLEEYIMKPYTRVHNLTVDEKIFNYRLSRARLIVECAFGLLTKKWRILEHPLDWKLENLEKIIMSLVCLYNFLITDKIEKDIKDRHYQNNNEEYPTDEDNIETYENRNPEAAYEIRNTLKDYFLSRYGQVGWQWQKI